MRDPDGLIFDLDGTLWDTNATCALAWNRVVARLGIRFRDIVEADVRGVAGQPHPVAIRCVFAGLDDADLTRLTEETAREDNEAIAALGGRLYPGVREHVPRLAARRRLAIVSNCQGGYVEYLLESSGLAAQFTDFECWGHTGRTKSENLRSVIERNRLRRPVFVGDTEGDQRAAIDNGVPFVHAAYGFGAVQGEDHRLETFADLVALFG